MRKHPSRSLGNQTVRSGFRRGPPGIWQPQSFLSEVGGTDPQLGKVLTLDSRIDCTGQQPLGVATSGDMAGGSMRTHLMMCGTWGDMDRSQVIYLTWALPTTGGPPALVEALYGIEISWWDMGSILM